MVSVGELGTRADRLEKNLAEILDIAHTWRAVLLIDEADVFLEQRQPQDVGRNALVSIFLRMLEYFQGILFLTTNRVATFDEAFQSRIHIGLRYGKLDVKTRKAVWEGFIGRVRALPDVRVAEFTEEDYTKLSNFEVNGREVPEPVFFFFFYLLPQSTLHLGPIFTPAIILILYVAQEADKGIGNRSRIRSVQHNP